MLNKTIMKHLLIDWMTQQGLLRFRICQQYNKIIASKPKTQQTCENTDNNKRNDAYIGKMSEWSK